MKHLYFVRHGQSFVNVGGKFCTQVGTKLDQGLTQLGKQQAMDDGLKASSTGLHFDRIFSSPLVRAYETASIIANEVGYAADRIETLDLIKEINFGELEGTNCELFYNFHTYADLNQFEGAETIQQLQQRAEQALEYINALPESTILIVSHSLFGRAFRRVVEHKPYTDEFTQGTSLPHGEILKLI